MLELPIKGREMFDEDTFEFKQFKDTTLKLEHSLVSVSKWEEEYKS